MSSRNTVRAIVAVVALAAAAVAVSVAWTGRANDGRAQQQVGGRRSGMPPLQLDVLVPDRGQAAALNGPCTVNHLQFREFFADRIVQLSHKFGHGFELQRM